MLFFFLAVSFWVLDRIRKVQSHLSSFKLWIYSKSCHFSSSPVYCRHLWSLCSLFDYFVPHLDSVQCPHRQSPSKTGFALTLDIMGQPCTPASRSSQKQIREGGIPGSKMYCWSSANKCKGEIMIFRRLFAAFAGGIRAWSQLQWSNQARFGSGLDWPHVSPF